MQSGESLILVVSSANFLMKKNINEAFRVSFLRTWEYANKLYTLLIPYWYDLLNKKSVCEVYLIFK